MQSFIACNTIEEIQNGRKTRKWFYIQALSFPRGRFYGNERPTIEIPAWTDPLSETQSAYRMRAQASIDQHVQRQEELKRDRGFIASAKKALHHFDWLALVQVKGWRYVDVVNAAITDDTLAADDPTVVRIAVERTAALIGVALRKIPMGAPRK